MQVKIVKLNEDRDPTCPYDTINTFNNITEALKHWDHNHLQNQGLSILVDDGTVSVNLRLMPEHFAIARGHTSALERLQMNMRQAGINPRYPNVLEELLTTFTNDPLQMEYLLDHYEYTPTEGDQILRWCKELTS